MIPDTHARMAAYGTVLALVLLSNENPGDTEETQGELSRLAKSGSLGLPGCTARSDPRWTVQEPVVTSREMTVTSRL